MNYLLPIAFLVFAPAAFAEGGGAAELLKNTSTQILPEKASSASKRVKLESTCTDENGRILKQADAGFNLCLSKATQKSGGTQDSKAPQAGASATYTFGQ